VLGVPDSIERKVLEWDPPVQVMCLLVNCRQPWLRHGWGEVELLQECFIDATERSVHIDCSISPKCLQSIHSYGPKVNGICVHTAQTSR
jgi:hypothetical protein